MYLGSELVYSAGGVVTYYVDVGITYTEEVESDATCLSPTTFTPTKSGYIFAGWREDATASSDILTEKTMGDDSVSLYAVFKKTISLTYYNGSSSASTKTGTQYYNNENIVNPTFTLTPATVSGFTFSGWCTSSSATASVAYTGISDTEFASDTTLYAKYYQTITLTYYSTSSTAATETGTRYYNSGNYTNPTFTISSPSLSGWSFLGWISGSTSATGTVSYTSISSTAFSANATLYAKFSKTITLTYYNNSTTASTQTGTRYFNAYGNYSNPTFTLTAASKSGWSFDGWCTGTAGNASIAYSSISSTTFTASATLYARYSCTITLSYNGNSATSGSTSSQTDTRYYNSAGNYSNPTFTLASNGFTRSCYSFSKWASGSASGTQYAVGASVTLSANTTFYAIWTANVCRLVINAVLSTSTSHSYTFDTGTFSLPQITLTCTLYTTATGSTVHKTSTLTNYPKDGSLSFCGLLTAVSYVLQAWNYVSEQYTDPYNLIKVTANKALYSNTGLSSTGLASGSVITFCADEIATMYLGGTTAQYQLDAIGYSKTLTYYVSGANVS
ncbi:MAG: InlB B-repeat-containing protein [Lachnospiraceae bacterium]|nr:InlB B-repeat-containing protein [Lachnospiraceae bacterium]